MTLGIFTSYFLPHFGGVENYTYELSSFLIKNKISPIVITCNTERSPSWETLNKIKVIRLDCWHFFGNTLPIPKLNKKNRNLIKKLMALKPELILTETRFSPASFWGAWTAKKNRIKQIHIEHGSEHVVTKSSLINSCFHLYDHLFGSFVIKNALLSIAISSRGQKLLRHLGAKKTKVIFNSLNLADFPYAYRHQQQINLAYVGRLIEAKGVQDLLEALKILKDDRIRLTIVGGGNFLSELKRKTNQSKNIIFKGKVDIAGVKKVLRNATILINPSYLEGLPSSVLEAGALGVPVIATDVGGTSDIIENNRSGILIPIKKPITIAKNIDFLIHNPKIRKKFSLNLRKTIEKKFSWSENIKQLIEIFRQ